MRSPNGKTTVSWLLLLLLVPMSTFTAPLNETQSKNESASSDQATLQEPPEEDEAYRQPEYAFNPIQAEHEFKVGNFYFKKGNYRAAIFRFQEAIRWNPSYAEAYRKLGEAYEKSGQLEEAREAYKKFLEVSSDKDEIEDVQGKLERLERKLKRESQQKRRS